MILPLIFLAAVGYGVYAYKRRLRAQAAFDAQSSSGAPEEVQVRRVVFPILKHGSEARFMPSTAYELTDDKHSAFLVAKQLPVDVVFSVNGEIPPPAQVFVTDSNEQLTGRLNIDRDITVRVHSYAKTLDSEGNYGDDAYSAMIVANTAGHNNDMRVFVEPPAQ